jgi:hypothetical protein
MFSITPRRSARNIKTDVEKGPRAPALPVDQCLKLLGDCDVQLDDAFMFALTAIPASETLGLGCQDCVNLIVEIGHFPSWPAIEMRSP